MLTPNGLSVRSRILTISSRTWSRRPDDVSMIPSAPAFDTADANCARAMYPIGAWTMGCSTPSNWVTRFSIWLTLSGWPRSATGRDGLPLHDGSADRSAGDRLLVGHPRGVLRQAARRRRRRRDQGRVARR